MKRSPLIAALLLAPVLTTCSASDRGGAYVGHIDPPDRPVLRIASGEDPSGLDPTRYSDLNSWKVARLLFEGLLSFTSEGRAVPGVAYRWNSNSDATEFTFYLRSDALWSDGTRVTSADFVFAWRRVLDREMGATTAGKFSVVKGAQKIIEGEELPETLGIIAPTDSILIVKLEHPDPDFPVRTAQPAFFPLPRDHVSGDYLNWPRGENVVGNGPFVLEEWRLNDRLIVIRNDRYWNRKEIYLEMVILFPIPDNSTALNLYRTGEIDWLSAGTVPVDQARGFLEAGYLDIHTSTILATYYLEFNTARVPLDDPRVRRALDLTVPREEIVRAFFEPGCKPVRAMVNTELPDWIPPRKVERNSETARRLLAEAGYPDGVGFPHLTYIYNIGAQHGDVAEFLQGTWQKELGIHIDPTPMDFATLEERGREGNFHIMKSIWLADLPAPIEFLEVFESGNPNNATRWNDRDFDMRLERARHTLDLRERNKLLGEAENLLLEDVPVIPILQYSNVQLIKPYVEGLKLNPLDVTGWTGVRINTEWRSSK